MDPAPGDRIGVYEISSLLGKGGMGEVYRARDTALKRDVALKILPPEFSRDPERAARFQREAEVLASLNHQNIAHLYGFAEADGVRALVMELAEGESPRGPMPFDEAWKIMAQVADGLEYAHERRVVHRDLKPSNLKVSPDGRVKILDFGLAKALSNAPRPSASPGTDSPTLTMGATQAGVVLGTAAYMAPEQIKGKEADRRADIWAFAIVLYELLTGERPFKGSDATEIMARAVTAEPVLDKAPANVRRLLNECLKKDPEDRLRWIGDVARFLDDANPPASPPVTQPRSRLWPTLTALFALTTALLLWLWLRPTPHEPAPVIRIATSLPVPLARSPGPIAISRDGTRLAYVAGPNTQIYYRTMEQLDAHPLPGTDNSYSWISFSPDGQQIAFVTGSTSGQAQLKKITLAGGSVQTLANVTQTSGPAVMDWGDDGNILFVDSVGLWQVPSTGGSPISLLKPDPNNGDVFFSIAQWLPGRKQILASVFKSQLETEVFAYDPQSHARKHLLKLSELQPRAQFVPSGASPASGYIAYYNSATASLMAVPFDVNRLSVSGVPVSVLDGVAAGIPGSPFGAFAVSNTGTLVYAPGAPTETQTTTLLRVDRKGKEEQLAAPPRTYQIARESPADPNRIALTIVQADQGRDLWVLDASRGTLDRITNDGNVNDPVWTPDGKRIIYHASTGTSREAVMWAPADRSAPPSVLAAVEGHGPAVPYSVSADGKLLFAYYPLEGKLWTLPLPDSNAASPASATPRAILDSQFRETQPAISPDGHWLAYLPNETGRNEVYLTSYPEAGPKITVSTEGGVLPRWSRSGKELFYVRNGVSMGVDIASGPPLRASRPKVLFTGNFRTYDVEPDGQHFLSVKNPDFVTPQAANDQLTIVFNWFEELRRRLPPPK